MREQYYLTDKPNEQSESSLVEEIKEAAKLSMSTGAKHLAALAHHHFSESLAFL